MRLALRVLLLLSLHEVGLLMRGDAAESPQDQSVKEATPVEPPITDLDREHWAFRPLDRSPVPQSTLTTFANPIDSFVDQKLHEKRLVPLPAADPLTLLRRVTFDLTGLPPTPAEMDLFLDDTRPDRFERLVDRLLASPGYGERWGQHWLDLARFADTDGFEFDAIRPNAWRYRDWVIEALNRDLPFDQFVQQQIAGDELWPDDPSAVIATGFLLCGPDMPDINDQEERRHTILNEMVGTVGSVFLGLSVGCAQCHDHKVDPISQADFYRLRAHFDHGELFKDHPVATRAERDSHEAVRKTSAPLERELKQLDDAARKRLREQNPDLQPTPKDIKQALTAEEAVRHEALTNELARLPKPPELPVGRVFKNGVARKATVAIRGDFRRPGTEVQPATLRLFDPVNRSSTNGSAAQGDSDRTGLRTKLARWLTSPDQVLVPRVMANRLWQHHFGEGLVRSVSDYGYGGSEPSHPKLLDWLAGELIRDGGLKRLHRLMVTSATYQRAARPAAKSPDGRAQNGQTPETDQWQTLFAADPDSRLLSHMTPRRLEGEAIRDALLSAAGVLSERRGGPGTRPPLPKELVSTLLKNQWVVSSDEEDHRRRSIHLMVRRNLRYPLFEVFDRPDTNATCPRRSRSTVAPQALALLNSEFCLAMAEAMANRLTREAESETDRITRAFQLCFGRPATSEEQARCQTFLHELDQAKSSPSGRSISPLGAMCLALFNANEFVYVD